MVPSIPVCQEGPGHCHAVITRALLPAFCAPLVLKPGNILQAEHGTLQIHQVSVTKEEKRGAFSVMMLISELCSLLN